MAGCNDRGRNQYYPCAGFNPVVVPVPAPEPRTECIPSVSINQCATNQGNGKRYRCVNPNGTSTFSQYLQVRFASFQVFGGVIFLLEAGLRAARGVQACAEAERMLGSRHADAEGLHDELLDPARTSDASEGGV